MPREGTRDLPALAGHAAVAGPAPLLPEALDQLAVVLGLGPLAAGGPAVKRDDVNLYRYLSDQPVTNVDSLGLASAHVPVSRWALVLLEEYKIATIPRIQSFTPEGLKAWSINAVLSLFKAPGDLVKFLGLSMLESKGLTVDLFLKEINGKFDEKEPLKVAPNGNTQSSFDPGKAGILTNLLHLGKLVEITKISTSATFDGGIDSIDNNAMPKPEAKVFVHMKVAIEMGLIKEVVEGTLKITLHCGDNINVDKITSGNITKTLEDLNKWRMR